MTEDQYRHLQERLRSIEKAVNYLEKKEKSRQTFRTIKTIAIVLIITFGYYYLSPYIDSLLQSITILQEIVASLPI